MEDLVKKLGKQRVIGNYLKDNNIRSLDGSEVWF
jgi:hypothetical protein